MRASFIATVCGIAMAGLVSATLSLAPAALAKASDAAVTPPSTSTAKAPPCRDAKGKFTKCPAAEAPKPKRCRDAKGRFAKCDAPGAKPQ